MLTRREDALLMHGDEDEDAELTRLREQVHEWRAQAARQDRPLRLPIMPFFLRNIWTGALLLFTCLSLATFFVTRVLLARVRNPAAPNRHGACARAEVESGRAEDAPSAPRPQELGREAARRARARHRRRGTPPPLRHELGLDRTRRQWRRVRAGELAVACGHRRGMRDGESIC